MVNHSTINPVFRIFGIMATSVLLLTGCVKNLPTSAWRYSPNEPGTMQVEKKLKVIVVPFDEGDDFEGVLPYSFKGMSASVDSALSLQFNVEPMPTRLAKWLAAELASSGYFESVKYADWKEAADLYSGSDLLVSGRIKQYTTGGPSFFWVIPPQSILFLLAGAVGIPVLCVDHELDMDIYAARPLEPDRAIWSTNIKFHDDLPCMSMWDEQGWAPFPQLYASRQKPLLKKVFLNLRDEMARELNRGGKINAALQ